MEGEETRADKWRTAEEGVFNGAKNATVFSTDIPLEHNDEIGLVQRKNEQGPRGTAQLSTALLRGQGNGEMLWLPAKGPERGQDLGGRGEGVSESGRTVDDLISDSRRGEGVEISAGGSD